MISFITPFFLTNLIFSITIGSFLIKLDKERRYPYSEIVLYSLGLGPIFTTLILYYFLSLLPNRSSLFYVSGILAVYTILFLSGKSAFLILWMQAGKSIKILVDQYVCRFKSYPAAALLGTLILIVIIISFLLYRAIFTPLDGYDSLQYATMGKIYFLERAINISGYTPYEPTGFCNFTNAAPSYSLLLTWEKMIADILHQTGDGYFKSTQVYYGLLIICLQFFWLSKKNTLLAILGVLSLISASSFFGLFLVYHLDSYRIYFLILSWIFLAYTIKNNDSLSILLFGVFSGCAAFSHSIGFVVAIFNVFVFFIFSNIRFSSKLKVSASLLTLIIMFGGIYYVIDIIWGSGWHFSPQDMRHLYEIVKWPLR